MDAGLLDAVRDRLPGEHIVEGLASVVLGLTAAVALLFGSALTSTSDLTMNMAGLVVPAGGTPVRSTVPGVIAATFVSSGEYVSTGQSIVAVRYTGKRKSEVTPTGALDTISDVFSRLSHMPDGTVTHVDAELAALLIQFHSKTTYQWVATTKRGDAAAQRDPRGSLASLRTILDSALGRVLTLRASDRISPRVAESARLTLMHLSNSLSPDSAKIVVIRTPVSGRFQSGLTPWRTGAELPPDRSVGIVGSPNEFAVVIRAARSDDVIRAGDPITLRSADQTSDHIVTGTIVSVQNGYPSTPTSGRNKELPLMLITLALHPGLQQSGLPIDSVLVRIRPHRQSRLKRFVSRFLPSSGALPSGAG